MARHFESPRSILITGASSGIGEALRGERLADAERISKDLLSALADAAKVLSLERRKVLDERVKRFRSMRRGGHRG